MHPRVEDIAERPGIFYAQLQWKNFHVNNSHRFSKKSQKKEPEYSSPSSFMENSVCHNKYLLVPKLV